MEIRVACCALRGRESRNAEHGARNAKRLALAATMLCLATVPLSATNLPPATVSFLDGSFLRGEIETLNGEALTWRHPNARRPIEFSTTNLNLIRLPTRSTNLPTNGSPVCRVVLTSGDEFEGLLHSLDADSFEIETWFAGKLRGQRSGLQSLAFYGSSQTALYDGPRAADEWKISTGAATVNRAGVDILGGRNFVFGGGIAVPQPVIPPAPVAQPIPAPLIRPANPGPAIARRAFTVEELARLSDDAEKSATVAVFLKTDLVKEALRAGQTSEAALEKWFADFKNPNDWAKDDAKAARFKVMLRAEVDVLVRRLQGRAAPFVEMVEVAPAPLPLPVPNAPPAEARPIRAVPAVPLNQVAPPPAPAIEPVVEAVRAEIERAKGKAAPGALPPLPPTDLTRRDTAPAAKAKPAPFDITRMSSTARFSMTVADYLKSDLVQLAVESGLVKADAFKAELDKQVAAGGEVRTVIRREGALLAARLLRELEHLKNDPAAATLARTQDLLGGVRAAPGAMPMPALPPKPVPGAAAERIAKGKPSTFDIARMSTAARFSNTIADYIKSDLAQLAIKAGVLVADTVKAELDKQAAAGDDERSLVWREGALLTARLLRELEHFRDDSSAVALANAYNILGRIRATVPVEAAVQSIPAHAAAVVVRAVALAQAATNAAGFTKSELVRAAADASVASERALERWFEDYTNTADLDRDKAKGDRFKALVKAESTMLGTRLLRTLGAGVGVAEAENLERQHAQAQAELAQGALAAARADALAQARARAMEALQLNNQNFALGAEAVLAGRAALAPAAGANSAWQFRDGAYYSTGVGTLGRECQLPTKARIEFDLAWKGQPYFRFSFFTRSTEHYDYSDGWQFYTSSSGYIYSMRRSGMGATSSSGARVPQMLAKNSVRFTFLVNTEAETVVLLADGEKVHEWKSQGSPGPGTGIVFYNYNSNSRVRLSDIRVAPWDGRERDAAEPPGAPGTDPDKLVEVPPADSAVVEFANRDRATGTLHGIRDGRLSFNPAGTKLEIPLARAALISFPVVDAPVLPKVEGVQVTLHRNERLTLALDKWEAEEITAISPVFGRLRLKPESIRTLRFNPSAPRGLVDEWSGP